MPSNLRHDHLRRHLASTDKNCRRKRYLRPFFCFCDLDLDPMTFTYELDPYFMDIYWMCKYELPASINAFESYHLTDRETDRQTDMTTIYSVSKKTSPTFLAITRESIVGFS